jgi:hypothetical protein
MADFIYLHESAPFTKKDWDKLMEMMDKKKDEHAGIIKWRKGGAPKYLAGSFGGQRYIVVYREDSEEALTEFDELPDGEITLDTLAAAMKASYWQGAWDAKDGRVPSDI